MKKLTLLLIMVLCSMSIISQTTTFTGAVNSDWHTSGNWTNGVPTTSTAAVIPEGTFVIASGSINVSGISNSGTMKVGVGYSISTGDLNNSGTLNLGNTKIKGIGDNKVNVTNTGSIIGVHGGKNGDNVQFDNVGTFANSGLIDVNQFYIDDVSNFYNHEGGDINTIYFDVNDCSNFANNATVVSRQSCSVDTDYMYNNGLMRSRLDLVSLVIRKDYCRKGPKSQFKSFNGSISIDSKKGDFTGEIKAGTESKSNAESGAVNIAIDTCWIVGDSAKIEAETIRFIFDYLDFISIDSIKDIYANSKIEFYGTASSILAIEGWAVAEDFIYVENGDIEIYTDSIQIFDHDINYYCYPDPIVGPSDTTFIQTFVESATIFDSVTNSGSYYLQIRSNSTGSRSFDYDISSTRGWVNPNSGSTQILEPFQFDSLFFDYTIPVTGDTLTDTIMVIMSVSGEYTDTTYSYLHSDKDMIVNINETVSSNNNIELNIVPNPSSGQFNITVSEDAEIRIFNLNGELINQFNLKKNDVILLNLDYFLSPGLYFIHVNSGESTCSEKLIIW